MSSHREAPLISEDSAADNTDVYAFRSPDRLDTVTIISNFVPLQEPAGGPNFHKFGDDVLYEIMIDNDGDAIEDITYQFRFRTTLGNPNTFLYNTGPITSLGDSDWNMRQFYSMTKVLGPRRTGLATVLASDLVSPPVNIGPRSTPDYEALASAAVLDLAGGIKVFAGQRDDPFFVDLGSVFDLAGLRPFNSLHVIPLAPEPGVDGLAGYNVHTIALQVPIAQLVRDPDHPTIGIWSSASRQKARVLGGVGHGASNPPVSTGPWVQVSRLGNPLINEVVIPVGQKDFWNASHPAGDEQFLKYYLEPEVTKLENLLYPVLDDASEINRTDLVAILLTGVPGLNFTGGTKADLLRLNTNISPSGPVGTGNRLGVLAGDFAGFPNGRRLEDDVVDIDLRAFAEGYGPILAAALSLPNRSPNNLLGDGVDSNEKSFLTTFPYLATPHQGSEHTHHGA